MAIFERATVRTFTRRETLRRKGEKSAAVLVVVRGALEIADRLAEVPIVFRTRGRGRVVGLSQTAGLPNSAGVVAERGTRVLEIRTGIIQDRLGPFWPFVAETWRHYGEIITALSGERQRDQLPLFGRICDFLITESKTRGGVLIFSAADLESRGLGSRARIDNVLRKLQTMRIIERSRKRIEIRAPAELLALRGARRGRTRKED